MKSIRLGVFETNSSSTHSCVICNDEDYKKWISGEALYCDWGDLSGKMVTVDEAMKNKGVDEYEEWLKDNEEEDSKESKISFLEEDGDYYSYEKFTNSEELESDENTFTTKGGEVIHIACRYGYDG